MKDIINKHRKTLIILLVVTTIGLFSWGLVQSSRFRVVGTIPGTTGRIATSTMGFRVTFNRELDPSINYMERVSGDTNVISRIKISSNTLTIYISPPAEGKRYKYQINNIVAKDGTVLPSLKFNYVTKYIPFNRLSREQQDLARELSEDRVNNPISKFLPYSTLNFKLEGVSEHKDESGSSVGEFGLVAYLYLSAADVRINREQAVQSYKQEVLDYIVSIGFSPDDYTIHYEIVESF